MTIKTSGALSMSEINAEFGLGTNLGAYRGVTWYTDAGGSGTFASTDLAMSAFYGKSKNPAGGTTGEPYSGSAFGDLWTGGFPANPPRIQLVFYSNGTWNGVARLSGQTYSGNWFTPTTSNIGASYSIRFTRTNVYGFSGTSTASTGFLALNSNPAITVERTTTGNGLYAALYTIEIRNSSGTIVSTSTNVELSAEVSI